MYEVFDTNQLCVMDCASCSPDRLTRDHIDRQRQALHVDWCVDEVTKEIVRTFHFGRYLQTISFVNAVAWIAEAQDHHPHLDVGMHTCKVHYSTHTSKGVSLKDFICAAKIDALL